MKIAFKNFLSTLRRYKISSLLNIVGLTLAFAAFYVIMVQVWWELGYNRSIPNADRIHLITYKPSADQSSFWAFTSRPNSEGFLEQSPDIEAGGTVRGGFTQNVWVRRGDEFIPSTQRLSQISMGLLDVLSPTIVDGDPARLAEVNTVALARSEAERLGLRAGGTLYMLGPGQKSDERPALALEVVAVYEDFPENSFFNKIVSMRDLGDLEMDKPNYSNDLYFVRLRKGTDPAVLADRWLKIYQEQARAIYEKNKDQVIEFLGEKGFVDQMEKLKQCECWLVPLKDLYFSQNIEKVSWWTSGTRSTTLSLLAVALLVIVIALINFVNFFFAMVPMRLRTVNIFKVFGAPTSSLRLSFLFEAVGFVVIALACAWGLSESLRSTALAGYFSTSLALTDNFSVVLLEIAVAVVASLVAGIYPAWYITSFNPALAAKGSFAGSRSGRRLRVALVSVQYVISIVLIVFTFFCYAQHRFIQRFDMGFDRDRVLTFNVPRKVAADFNLLASRLESDPQIVDVTASASPFVAESWQRWGSKWKNHDMLMMHLRFVKSNFLDAMHIPVLEGNGFKPEHDNDSIARAIVPRSVAMQYDIRIGEMMLGKFPVVGICDDFYFRPLQYATEPMMFLVGQKGTYGCYYLRLLPGADVKQVCDRIRSVILELAPESDAPDIRFMNDQMNDLYAKENRLSIIIATFALLSVAIALIGVFGLVLFETQHRRREIAIRKVMGATTGEILAMFNRRYALITLVCFVLAAPIAWWCVDRWLSGFAYHLSINVWVFLAALLAVMAVTVVTVTLRSLSAARCNPADAMKAE